MIAEGEETGPLQEELTLLWKEEIEPRQVDLHVVGLDLCEVGVVGHVQGEIRAYRILDVHAGVTNEVGLTGGFDTLAARDAEGLDLDVTTASQILQAGKGSVS